MAKSEEPKNLLMKVKGESEKAGLKLSLQKTKIMAFSPITSWQIEGEKSENRDRFYFLGLLNCGDCSREIKRCLLLGKKAVTNLNSIIKSRDLTLPTKICTFKPMVFAVVTCGCES